MKAIILLFSLAIPVCAQSGFHPLFNGKDLTGWSPVLEKLPAGEDPQHLVTVHDGVIHMYQNVKAGDKAPFGVIVSDASFSRYHLRFQYQWCGKKFAPRTGDIRDAGVIYHAYEFSKVWPKGIENQVQEGDTGDLIWCDSNGLTWMRPDGQTAPEGQGLPGLLPEDGGLLREIGFKHEYIGRFPEHDNYEGWNNVDIIVQADEWAVHKINGRVHTRLRDFKKQDGTPLAGGRITFQLEGAELQYRNIEVKELDKPLHASLHQITLASMHGKTAGATVTLTNPGAAPLDASPRVIGKDSDSFTVEPASASIAAGASADFHVNFAPAGFGGRYCAAIQFGNEETGALVPVNALGHGDGGQPTLQEIIDTLSIPAIAWSWTDPRDQSSASLGESIHATTFTHAKDGKASVMPVASFPDDGADIPDLSIFTVGDPAFKSLKAAASNIGFHPALVAKSQAGNLSPADSVELAAADYPFVFGLSVGENSSTDPSRVSNLKVNDKACVFKITRILESKLTDAYLVCFETGGRVDYNDAIFLLTNVLPCDAPMTK